MEPAADGDGLGELVKPVDAGLLTPRGHARTPWRATDAYGRLAEGGVRGRLVLAP
ncbi:hypothetical protein ABT185_04285 [Streptomyces clavifer]|uniref:hypothetical protein n=1 Tax=Streptomyces clavifer TaxID=68188 RepID=UPI00332BF2E2